MICAGHPLRHQRAPDLLGNGQCLVWLPRLDSDHRARLTERSRASVRGASPLVGHAEGRDRTGSSGQIAARSECVSTDPRPPSARVAPQQALAHAGACQLGARRRASACARPPSRGASGLLPALQQEPSAARTGRAPRVRLPTPERRRGHARRPSACLQALPGELADPAPRSRSGAVRERSAYASGRTLPRPPARVTLVHGPADRVPALSPARLRQLAAQRLLSLAKRRLHTLLELLRDRDGRSAARAGGVAVERLTPARSASLCRASTCRAMDPVDATARQIWEYAARCPALRRACPSLPPPSIRSSSAWSAARSVVDVVYHELSRYASARTSTTIASPTTAAAGARAGVGARSRSAWAGRRWRFDRAQRLGRGWRTASSRRATIQRLLP